MKYKIFQSNFYKQNSYILDIDNKIIVVDPGCNEVVNYIEEQKIVIDGIVLTHGHFDHIWKAEYLSNKFPNAKVFIHENDFEALSSSDRNLSKYYTENEMYIDCFGENEMRFNINDKIIKFNESTNNFLGLKVEISNLPGHSPGSCSIQFTSENIIFVGDVIMKYAIGPTHMKHTNHEDQIESIKKIYKYLERNKELDVLCGHDKNFKFNDLIHNKIVQEIVGE